MHVVKKPAKRGEVLRLVHGSDLGGLDELVGGAEGLPRAAARALHRICRLAGGVQVIDEVDALEKIADICRLYEAEFGEASHADTSHADATHAGTAHADASPNSAS